MLEIEAQRNNLPTEKIKTINRISHNQLTYNDFFNKYMLTNWPIIITDISKNWDCQRNWCTSSDENQSFHLNIEYLKSKIPNVNVPIANCQKEYSNSHEKFDMKFYEFLEHWQMKTDDNDNCYYLKDWHLAKQLPDYEFYQNPIYFGSDWLNEYLAEINEDDYKFVYMGPKGTWTPFHADVFSSYSWSTNIFGRKKWIFLEPNEETKIADHFNNLPFSINETLLNENHVHYHVCVQKSGECIFVPSGWYHQVENLDDTISINHNWLNGCNVMEIWKKLWQYYGKVCKEIDDCRDMDDFEQHCQLMLKATHGMNFNGFLALLQVIVKNRLKCLSASEGIAIINGFAYGKEHCRFDLNAILCVLHQIKINCDKLSDIVEMCLKLETIINHNSE